MKATKATCDSCWLKWWLGHSTELREGGRTSGRLTCPTPAWTRESLTCRPMGKRENIPFSSIFHPFSYFQTRKRSESWNKDKCGSWMVMAFRCMSLKFVAKWRLLHRCPKFLFFPRMNMLVFIRVGVYLCVYGIFEPSNLLLSASGHVFNHGVYCKPDATWCNQLFERQSHARMQLQLLFLTAGLGLGGELINRTLKSTKYMKHATAVDTWHGTKIHYLHEHKQRATTPILQHFHKSTCSSKCIPLCLARPPCGFINFVPALSFSMVLEHIVSNPFPNGYSDILRAQRTQGDMERPKVGGSLGFQGRLVRQPRLARLPSE